MINTKIEPTLDNKKLLTVAREFFDNKHLNISSLLPRTPTGNGNLRFTIKAPIQYIITTNTEFVNLMMDQFLPLLETRVPRDHVRILNDD